ncbi:STAS/SEC14 domain-containing protein [Spartinivicinus poritis]|uniref:STAS/SEC14 domain-containing protein n=1 Tax=Spartinivicinus poritis TaxID=2994640 RepID=A0ABT5UF12_9GAMM|nr:STAS/SEC14 domain-containing protein [Spartinivicinus sp. A2-2]MDE1464975.1 STAS/SEC14 domain-containing protein [Spartinivicinus sp. A2-2]
MLELIPNLPDNLIGVIAKGKVTGHDYDAILIPIIEDKINSHGKVRLLYQLGEEFEGFDLQALWDDAKLGVKHFKAWEKVAIVTNLKWIRHAVQMIGFLIPGEYKIFENHQFNEAKAWVCS